MNYIINVLILIILIGIYNIKQTHIDNNLFLVSTISTIILSTLYLIINKKTKENYTLNIDNELKSNLFELSVYIPNDVMGDKDLYLHSTIPHGSSNSDCYLSGANDCRDVCVVNGEKHNESEQLWSFVKKNDKYEIKYGADLYLSITSKGNDCKSIYEDGVCYDVILVTAKTFNESPTYWILEPQRVPGPPTLYCKIRAYFNDMMKYGHSYYLHYSNGGNDCQEAGLDGNNCKNVFLARDSDPVLSSTKNPVYWKFTKDLMSSSNVNANFKEDELQIIKTDKPTDVFDCTKVTISGDINESYICTNLKTGIEYRGGEIPSGAQWKCVQLGIGDDWLCLPRSSPYKLKTATKKELPELREEGYATTTYDYNNNFIGIKHSDENDNDLFNIPHGHDNFAVHKHVASIILSSPDSNNYPAINVIDEDLNTYCKSAKMQNPKLYIYLKDDIIIKKIVIRQTPHIKPTSNRSMKNYPIGVTIVDGLIETPYGPFQKPNGPEDSSYVIDSLSTKAKLIIIEVPETGILSLQNIYIIGKLAYEKDVDKNVRDTIKNERSLCKLKTKQDKDKFDIQLRESIMETEETTRQKTITDILEFINTPQSIIIWENIGNIPCKIFKLELLRQEYLHISNIQIFGKSDDASNSIQKDWAKDSSTRIRMSSLYTDDSDDYFGPDRCVDDDIYTYCRTMNTSNPHPFIMLYFKNTISVDKIIIYNRKDKNRERLTPCKLSLLDKNKNTILYAIKEDFNKNIIVSKSFMESPVGCLSFNELNITDIGDVNKFRGWADVEGTGNKCNFCRVVGKSHQQYFSCASNTGDNEYKYNTLPNINLGMNNSIFMHDMYGSNKDDFCRCVGNKYDNHVECLVNNLNNTNSGFNIPHQTNIPCYNKTGDQLLHTITDKLTNPNNIDSRIDTGFYNHLTNEIWLFKNTTIDNKNMVLFVKIDRNTNKIKQHSTIVTTTSNGSLPNLPAMYAKKIDCVTSNGLHSVYFFVNDTVTEYNIKTNTLVKKPDKIKNVFKQIPFDSIDEAYYAGDNIIIFFKDNKFIQYDLSNINANNNSKLRIIVTPISQGNYGNMNFTKIDTAISFYTNESSSDEILFTHNSKCILYNNLESNYDEKFNKIVDINDMFPNLWEISINSLNNYSTNVKPQNDTINSAINNTNSQNETNDTSRNNRNTTSELGNNMMQSSNSNVNSVEYNTPKSSCNLFTGSIKDTADLIKNNQIKRFNNLNCPTTSISIEETIKDINSYSNVSEYLKHKNKSINTLSCELKTSPSDLFKHINDNTLDKYLES
jgi:hypothetical protein